LINGGVPAEKISRASGIKRIFVYVQIIAVIFGKSKGEDRIYRTNRMDHGDPKP
jgi:hypothetical protein